MRRLRHSRVWFAGLLISSLAGVACGGSQAAVVQGAALASPAAEQPESRPAGALPPTASPTSPPLPVTLVAVGDLMLGRSVGYRIEAGEGASIFEPGVSTVLGEADIAVGNLESAVSAGGEPQAKSYTFRAPPAASSVLAAAGFDVLSLANNHALDYGRGALADTEALLRAAGIQPVGSGRDLSAALSPVVLERGGLRIAFVALVDAPAEGSFTRSNWEAGADRAGVAWADDESVARAVSDAAAVADVVVALLHFGYEFHESPSAGQRALARAAIDAGADLVVGSHPHVLQPVEAYGGGLIAYSLGNFVFDGFEGIAESSAMLRVTLTSEGVGAWELIPVRIPYGGLPRLLED